MSKHKAPSLVEMAEAGDRNAQKMVDTIGFACLFGMLVCVGILIYLIVWAIVFTVNGGNWMSSIPGGGV